MAIFSSFSGMFQNSKSTDGVLNSPSYVPSIKWLLLASIGCLLVLSLLMVTSASIPFTEKYPKMGELFFFKRQLAYAVLGSFMAYTMTRIPLKWVYHLNVQFFVLLVTLILLIVTLFGSEINGAKRWIELGVINFQTAELAKLVVIVFTADFVVRRSSEVRTSWDGFIRILVIVGLITLLLLAQPDFGSVAIIAGCVLTIFWVAGAPMKQFAAMATMVAVFAYFAIVRSDYRLGRVTSFMNPFDDIQDTDYQLARSIIAFGRGEFNGVGYGESVQKLAHLPEAHTDFLLAITGEELGFIGVACVLLLEATVIACIMRISYLALKRKQMRISYTAFGIATMFIGQTLVNAGMNMGLLPTKGLTMPFFSYGGSAMLMSMIMIGLVLRICKESAEIPANQSRNY
ncbi:putative lipid II flippase FtsW [Psychrobacter sp. HD31]|uniref:putative lipid II flippase FtsW n=1 Tax=Psychrobacter sp. HD31 TaxID=3112003 RepID=UPI003DA3C189